MISNNVFNKKSILVVDDYEGCRMVLAALLTDCGYDVDSAQNGLAALELIKNKHFDLVITDLEMPGLTGIDLLREIKTIMPDTKVIITSGNGTVDSYMEAMVLGASEYLNKPLEIKRLTRAVSSVFLQYQQPRLAA